MRRAARATCSRGPGAAVDDGVLAMIKRRAAAAGTQDDERSTTERAATVTVDEIRWACGARPVAGTGDARAQGSGHPISTTPGAMNRR